MSHLDKWLRRQIRISLAGLLLQVILVTVGALLA